MKQFQFEYKNKKALAKEITKIKQWCDAHVTSQVFFEIFTESLNTAVIERIGSVIDETMPESFYIGASTNGDIISGKLSKRSVTVNCIVLEYPSSKVAFLQLPLAHNGEDAVRALRAFVDKNPWIKAIQMLVTIRGMSMTSFCDHLSVIRHDIQFFGGGAFNNDLNDDKAFVFSKGHAPEGKSVVFLALGGDDFYVHSFHITGWKPLGKELVITKAKDNVIYEINHLPAYYTYYKYLKIRNDKNFFLNTLEFPLFYHHHGIDILRAPIACNPNGSLVMTADTGENVKAHLAYGDPHTILNSIRSCGREIEDFAPESILLFSCAARKSFWGADADKETAFFEQIAPTFGFYTSGEFVRTGRYVNQHNVTLVVAAMREGEREREPSKSGLTPYRYRNDNLAGEVSMITRLATFIDAYTYELKEAYDKLYEANKKLETLAITDRLTGLFNRGEIQDRISEAVRKYNNGSDKPVSLIMIDVDNFKHVNDAYGHMAGDVVLKELSAQIKHRQHKDCPQGASGRWGGEEFMILLPNTTKVQAADIAEHLRKTFADTAFNLSGKQTISLGVTTVKRGETSDALCNRVDSALYDAKAQGKNRVTVV